MNTENMPLSSFIKIGLAILLFLCLLHWPYGYYQLIRYAGMVGFGILAYKAYEKEQVTEAIIYAALALLFQPFIKVALGREVWNIVDVIVGIGLLVSVAIDYRKSNK